MSGLSSDIGRMDVHIGLFNIRQVFRLDWTTVLLVVVLAAVGLMTLHSASSGVRYDILQAKRLALGVVLALGIACVDARFLVSLGPPAYVVGNGLLVATLLFGAEAKGAERWIDLGFLHFQPSELNKVALVLMLAWYLGKLGPRIRKLHWLVLAFGITLVPMALIVAQPSLSVALTLGPVVFVMVFTAGARIRHLAAMVLLAGAGATLVLLSVFDVIQLPEGVPQLDEYQKNRIRTFADPSADPAGKGWQSRQSQLSVGSGGVWGKGFKQGTHTRLRYVPEHHNDFIFSLLAEEFGFVGAVAVLALFLLLFFRGIVIARDCPELSGSVAAMGAVTILAFHTLANIGITIGLLPVTGMPLPFLSYGGTFYLTTMTCVGILLSVHLRRRGAHGMGG
jgi:rod shape determining protein RodA